MATFNGWKVRIDVRESEHVPHLVNEKSTQDNRNKISSHK